MALKFLLLSGSAPKITERERKFALIFALKMESYFLILRTTNPSKALEFKIIFLYHASFSNIREILYCPAKKPSTV